MLLYLDIIPLDNTQNFIILIAAIISMCYVCSNNERKLPNTTVMCLLLYTDKCLVTNRDKHIQYRQALIWCEQITILTIPT